MRLCSIRRWCPPGARTLAAWRCSGQAAEPLGVLEHADACVDLQRRPQLDVHGAHEMVLLEQQQGLPVDLLGTELLCDILAA